MTYVARRAAPRQGAGWARGAAGIESAGDIRGPAGTSQGRDDRHRRGFSTPVDGFGNGHAGGNGYAGNGYAGDGYADRRPPREYGTGNRYGADERYPAELQGPRAAGELRQPHDGAAIPRSRREARARETRRAEISAEAGIVGGWATMAGSHAVGNRFWEEEEEAPPPRRRRDRAKRADRAERVDPTTGGQARRDRWTPAVTGAVPPSARDRGRGAEGGTGSVVLEGVRWLDEPSTGRATYPAPGIHGGGSLGDGREGRKSGGLSQGAGDESLQAWVEHARRSELARSARGVEEAQDREEAEEVEDGPTNHPRRQLLTSLLALGGLGVTGWVAGHMAGDGPAGAATSSSTAPVTAGSVPAAGPEPAPTMSQDAWQAPITLGNGEIDAQHERVMDLVDQLEDAMRSGQSRRRQARVLGDLVSWVKVHFAFEEALMDSYSLPGSATHKAHHRAFLAEIEALAKKFAAGSVNLTPDVISMLHTWLTEHVSNDDRRLVKDLNARGVPSAI